MLSSFCLRLKQALDGITLGFGKLAGWLLLALMFVILADVSARNLFGNGFTELQELEWHLNGAAFMLGLAWATLRDKHVRIEILSQNFSDERRAFIDLTGTLFLLIPYTGAILWFGADYVALSYQFNEASATAGGLPMRWLIKGVTIFGAFLLMLAGLSRALAAALYLALPSDIKHQSGFVAHHQSEGAS